MFFRRTASLVGLDIGSSAVKAVELDQTGNGYRVSAIGSEPLPPHSIVEGAFRDAPAVAEAIRRVFDRTRIKTREVVVSVPGTAVMVKKITMPLMSDDELAESIHWEAAQHIPFDIQEVNLDYQVLQAGSDGIDQGTMELLLVAAKKEHIADCTGVIALAGRVPVVVDVDAFALQNAFEANYGVDMAGTTVLINAGASAVNVNIVKGGRSLFTRDTSIGGNACTEALQKDLSLTFEDADLLKRGVSAGGVTFEEAVPTIRAVSENLLQEIEKTIDFFKSTAVSDHIDQFVLSGGAAGMQGFGTALEHWFELPVSSLDPFRQIAFDTKGVSEDQQREFGSTAAVAVGLALRRVDDR